METRSFEIEKKGFHGLVASGETTLTGVLGVGRIAGGEFGVVQGHRTVNDLEPQPAPFGEIVREARQATIIRASKLEQLWTRLTGDFEVMELCEFSFSEEVTL